MNEGVVPEILKVIHFLFQNLDFVVAWVNLRLLHVVDFSLGCGLRRLLRPLPCVNRLSFRWRLHNHEVLAVKFVQRGSLKGPWNRPCLLFLLEYRWLGRALKLLEVILGVSVDVQICDKLHFPFVVSERGLFSFSLRGYDHLFLARRELGLVNFIVSAPGSRPTLRPTRLPHFVFGNVDDLMLVNLVHVAIFVNSKPFVFKNRRALAHSPRVFVDFSKRNVQALAVVLAFHCLQILVSVGGVEVESAFERGVGALV